MAVDKQNHAILKALMRHIGLTPSWSLFRNQAPEHLGQFAAGLVAELLNDADATGHPTEAQLVSAYSFGYLVVHTLAGRVNVPAAEATAAFALPFKREHFSHQADALFNLRMAAVHAMVLSKAPQSERAVRDAARALLSVGEDEGPQRDEAFNLALDNVLAVFERYVTDIPNLCVQHGVL
jgi:hypothetical protein